MTTFNRDYSRFADRTAAGRELAEHLRTYAARSDLIVLALPRGGLPVAFEIAEALAAPLDIFLVRKLGTPGHHELAMGAIASGGVRVLNDEVVQWYGITSAQIDAIAKREQAELERREAMYREPGRSLDLKDRVVILVDDGLATGSTMRAAVQAVKAQQPARVIVAVPVGARETCAALRAVADEVVCARMPQPFSAVGQWYVNFDQTTDEEVRALLRQHKSQRRGPHSFAS